MGGCQSEDLRVYFHRTLKLKFLGSKVTTDAGLLGRDCCCSERIRAEPKREISVKMRYQGIAGSGKWQVGGCRHPRRNGDASLRGILPICFMLGVSWAFGIERARADVEVGDAYAQAGNGKWTIGTRAAEITFEIARRQTADVELHEQAHRAGPRVYRREECHQPARRRVGDKKSSETKSPWIVQKAETIEVKAGGRRTVQLNLTMMHDTVQIHFHVLAYPGNTVFRQWTEIENLGKEPYVSPSQDLYTLGFRTDDDAFTNYWLVGGANKPDLGEMREAKIADSYRQEIAGKATAEYVPWMGFRRNTAQGDGCFVFLDYLGNWSLVAARGIGICSNHGSFGRSDELSHCPGREVPTSGHLLWRVPSGLGRYGAASLRLAV